MSLFANDFVIGCEIEAVKWSPNGEAVACSTWNREVKIYDLASEKLIDGVKTNSGDVFISTFF